MPASGCVLAGTATSTSSPPARVLRRLYVRSALLVICVSVSGVLCGDEPAQAAKITFDDHVKPILREHCFSCHNLSDKKGGLVLENYTSLREGGGSGDVVFDDGDVENSRLWLMVNHEDTPNMPPNQDKLPDEKLAVIRNWIEGGILENSGSKARAKKKNSLAFVSAGNQRPADGGAMPAAVPQQTPVVTQRAAAATAIAASPWAPVVAIGGQQQIVLYHADTHELLGVLPFADGIPQSIRFSGDGAYLVVSGGEHSVRGIVAIYDVTSGQRVATIGDELDVALDGDANDSLTHVALGGPRRLLRIYDATDGTQLFELKKHTDWILSVAYSPDGVLIASGDRAGGLCVWEAETGQLYLDLTGHKGAVNRVAWRDDSNVLASASDDGTIKLWDMQQGNTIKSISAHGGGVTDVDFDHQGRLLSAGKDKRVKLWDAAGNHVRDFQPMGEQVLETAISHDGARVFYGDWSGLTLSALTADPAQTTPLAANPPPLETRVGELRTRVDSLQAELGLLEQQLASANSAVAAAQDPINALQTRIDASHGAAEQAQAEVAASQAQLEQLRAAITQGTDATRDAHDEVIVKRHVLKAEPTAESDGHQTSIATAEEALAQRLIQLARQRRELLTTQETIAAKTDLIQSERARVDSLTAQLPQLQTNLEAAEAQAANALGAHDAMANRVEAEQAKLERWTAELAN